MTTPRDLFDWQAIETSAPITVEQRTELAHLLVDKYDDIFTALARMPEKKLVTQAWSKIKAPEVPDLKEVLDWAHGCLKHYEAITSNVPGQPDRRQSRHKVTD